MTTLNYHQPNQTPTPNKSISKHTPTQCQFNCMELTTDRFPRLRTNKSRPDKCTGCTGMLAHGALEDNPSDDDPLLATCSLM